MKPLAVVLLLLLFSVAGLVGGEAGVSEPLNVADRYEWEDAALASFNLSEGFEISLVAAEPHLANPVSMTLDEDGRIYVANAHSYRQKWWLMNPPPPMEPSNPVVCLTPGPEGRATEATLVAEGFENPVMGLAVRGGRLWGTNLNRLFVTGLDAQGRMTGEPKVLIRDAATPWNPFGMYRVVRGPDDLLYLSVGDHDTQLAGPTGKAAVRLDHKGSGGVFRFRDDGSELELLLQGMRAPFTLAFTPFGRLWVITNGEGSPNCLLDAVRGTDYRFRNGSRGDWAWLTGAEKLAAPAWETEPGAHTAVLPYYSSALPEEYWGNLFVSNFGVHGTPAKKNEVLRLVLDDRGRVIRSEPFISCSDSKFRPTQVSLAPDGSLYLLDWYGNDDENDLTGRLYRVRYTGKGKLPERGRGLGNRNHTQRHKAQADLLAAGADSSLPAIDATLSSEDALAAAEALWTLRRSGWASAPDHIRKAVSHADWRVRRLAVQLLREMGKQKEEDLQRLLSDPDPAVQLEAALGFRDPLARCAALVQALSGGAAKIRRLRFAAALEIARYGQAEHFAKLLADGDAAVRLAGLIALDEAFYESGKGFTTIGKEPSRCGVAPDLTARAILAQCIMQPGELDPADLLDLARRWPHENLKSSVRDAVMARLSVSDVSAAEFAQGLSTLTRMGLTTSDEEIDAARIRLLDGAVREGKMAREKLALLAVLEAGSPRAGDLSLLKSFLGDENAAVRAKVGSLLGTRHVGDTAVVALCRDLALDENIGLPQRLDALVTLAKLEKTADKDSWTKLLLSPSREIVLASLRSLQSCADHAAAGHLLDSVAERLRRQHGSAIDDDLTFARAALSGEPVAACDKESLRQKVLADCAAGSPELGRLVYQTRACYNCHTVGISGMPAPQLDRIAATHDTEYLVDSILYPGKAVKTGFLTQLITIAVGGNKKEVVTGTLRRDVSGEGRWAEVTDNTGKRKLYRSSAIIDEKAISLMAPDLETTMSRTELVDLITYLKTLK